ncbi:MAG TPA: hypothetical protein VIH35_09680, partial [Kiritimatiellia bacterium]
WVRCSLDGFATELAAGPTASSFGANPMHVIALGEADVTGSVTFRIGATQSGNSGAKWRVDNIQLEGSVETESFRTVSIRKNSPLAITWESSPSRIYRVDYATNAISSAWVTLYTNITATSSVTTVTDDVLTDRVRIYRVSRLD